MARSREGTRRFLRRGSIPVVVHGLAEYGLGILFIVGPSALSFDSDTAKVVSILIGAGIIAMADIALEMEDEREIAETLEEISSGAGFWSRN